MDKNEFVLINWLKCAILDIQPVLAENIDVEKIFYIAERHSVENILYLSLAKIDHIAPKVMFFAREKYKQSVLNDAAQSYYLDIIKNEFEENGIKYCVMKGPVIKKLYPSRDLRKSSDLDIFVEDKYTEKARDILEKLGFSTLNFDHRNAHDQYLIDKRINVEIHRRLISRRCPWQKECQKIAERLLPVKGKKYEYEMTKEDYYIYMIAHIAKHMQRKGAGIKMIMDVWIYLNYYKDTLNRALIDIYIHKCGLTKFERNIRRLCKFWFENGESDELIDQMSSYVIGSGSFGSFEQLDNEEAAKNSLYTANSSVSKMVTCIRKFFLPYRKMRLQYTVLKKYSVLLPICWIHRGINILLHERYKIKDVSENYNAMDIERGAEIVNLKRNIGL